MYNGLVQLHRKQEQQVKVQAVVTDYSDEDNILGSLHDVTSTTTWR